MADEFDSRPVVIDIGSSGFKCGFGGEDSPRGAEPCIHGEYYLEFVPPGLRKYDFYGSEVIPVVREFPLHVNEGYWAGVIKQDSIFEGTYHQVFYHVLRVDPEEHPVLLADSLGTSKRDRERNISLMFETFGVPQLCIVPQPTLALYSTGRTTGFVLDSGCGATQFSPIYEGCPLEPGSVRIEFGGFDVSSSFERMFRRTHDKYSHVTLAARYLVDKTFDNLKIEHAYVAKDLEEKPEKTEFKDAHGDVWTLESERTRCAEILFDPKLAGKDFEGVDNIAFDTIEKCSSELRRDLWSSFVVSGGNTMLKGFCERLESSLRRRSDTPHHSPRSPAAASQTLPAQASTRECS